MISFLGRDDNNALCGQWCVLTETVLFKIRSLLCVGGDGTQVLSLVEHDANGLQSRRRLSFYITVSLVFVFYFTSINKLSINR